MPKGQKKKKTPEECLRLFDKYLQKELQELFDTKIRQQYYRAYSEAAYDTIFTYKPSDAHLPNRYKRRPLDQGIGAKDNIIFNFKTDLEGHTFTIYSKAYDSTPLNNSVLGTKIRKNERLGEMISGISDNDKPDANPTPSIPNIFNDRTDYEWARPNYRPYLQTANEIFNSDAYEEQRKQWRLEAIQNTLLKLRTLEHIYVIKNGKKLTLQEL